jgi:hypothetical protein
MREGINHGEAAAPVTMNPESSAFRCALTFALAIVATLAGNGGALKYRPEEYAQHHADQTEATSGRSAAKSAVFPINMGVSRMIRS